MPERGIAEGIGRESLANGVYCQEPRIADSRWNCPFRPLCAQMQFCLALAVSRGDTLGDQARHGCNQRYEEQYMDKRPSDVKAPSEQPEDQQNSEDHPEHELTQTGGEPVTLLGLQADHLKLAAPRHKKAHARFDVRREATTEEAAFTAK